MNTRDKMNLGLTALLIAGAKDEPAIEGHVYAALQMAGYNLADWNLMYGIATASGLVKRTAKNPYRNSEKGNDLAKQIEEHFSSNSTEAK